MNARAKPLTLPAEVLAALAALPIIGAPFENGTFAGLVAPSTAAGPDELLIDLGYSEKGMSHKKAEKWALERDGVRPSRADGRILHANIDSRRIETLPDDWFWLDPLHESARGYAWVQYFANGGQGYLRLGYDYRARAVRRVPLIR